MTRDAATLRQIEAARPDSSTWLSANAGSGKTRVLTDRVARLLLDGVSPEHILCLTYTKAAASEMQNRLFDRLGAWAMLPNDRLAGDLLDLGAPGPMTADRLRHARTLFARAIETPGGLKIQTIHSFCAGLLRKFPLEAGVSPQFTEMEERASELLRAQIVEEMADGAEADLVTAIARLMSDGDFDRLTKAITGMAPDFAEPLDEAALLGALGLPADARQTTLADIAFDGSEKDLLRQAGPILAGQSPTMAKLADTLAALNLDAPDESTVAALFPHFLYQAKGQSRPEAKTGSVPTKKAQEALGPLLAPFHALMERVARARNHQLALAAVDRSLTLHGFARAYLPRYARAKMVRGWLDFDDLILRARNLLSDPAVAQWVLFRIDGGIDHILVDEAQDTSPLQWQVIALLAQEFTSGAGARSDVARTIFVVGDKKQSIYSFQGADPREFDRMCAEFEARITAMDAPFAVTTLDHSFRSAPAILRLVDVAFQASPGVGASTHHIAFKDRMPGRVDLWPVVEASDAPEDGAWYEPVDRRGPENPDVQLAARIAAGIGAMLGTAIPHEIGRSGDYAMRPVRPGDFLILVQQRGPLFHEIIRACKKADLPIAGADVLKIGAELAVRDLAALLRVLATPEDDLSLAEVLKSPLAGWSEQQLYTLAQGRGRKYLWQVLHEKRADHPDTLAMFDDLRARADYLRPFDLIERILTRHDGRRRLLGRLGPEAEDGIDALRGQALAFERNAVPSLTGFLNWMATDDLVIKRQVDEAEDRIRVMTVHGAKGLEAPIVILPDTAKRRNEVQQSLIPAPGGPLWAGRADDRPAALAALIDGMKEAQMAERERLLYVAMTRAEKWLIVAAAGDIGTDDSQSWYARSRAALEAAGAAPLDTGHGPGLRLETGDWSGPVTAQPDMATEGPAAETDPVFLRDAPTPAPRPKTLRPSDLGGAKALPGDEGADEEAAKRRGTQIHLLLEHLPDLPPAVWTETAGRLLGPDVDPAETGTLLDEAGRILARRELAWLFAPGTLAEVPVSADLPGLGRIHGTIDRLVIGPDRILAVDFKTNRVLPETPATCPDGLLRQMGAYAAALAQIWPDRRIEVAILWTRAAQLMTLPHDLVTNALRDTRLP